MNAIDSSALIAYITDEPGGEGILPFLDGALISAVNYSEVLQKLAQRGLDAEDVRAMVRRAEIGVVALDDRLALETAGLYEVGRKQGLSLADRACLALARAVNGVAVTADTAWAKVDAGVRVHVIR